MNLTNSIRLPFAAPLLVAALLSLAPSPASAQTNSWQLITERPRNGAFYSLQLPNLPPLPMNPLPEQPLWRVSEGIYVIQDLDVDYSTLDTRTSGQSRVQTVQVSVLTIDTVGEYRYAVAMSGKPETHCGTEDLAAVSIVRTDTCSQENAWSPWAGGDTGRDYVSWVNAPPPWTNGRFAWDVPVIWRVGNGPTNALTRWTQTFTIDAAGTLRIEKFERYVQRTTDNDITHD